MLTGQGLIGKLVEFLATKLIGHKIDLALDDRKRACRAFTELYYCVERLEEITSNFLKEIDILLGETDAASGDARWVINEFHNQSHLIESVSRRFLELGSELGWAIDLYDPTLASTVNQLYAFKYSFLHFLSDSIEIKQKDGKNLQLLEYKEPRSELLKIDMESYYNWVKENEGQRVDPDAVEWPINFLRFSDFDRGFKDSVIAIEDKTAAKRFGEVIRTHASALSEARAKLREFLIGEFKIDEVLYISKGLPRHWY